MVRNLRASVPAGAQTSLIHETVLLCALTAGVRAEAVRRLSEAGLVFFTAESTPDGLAVMDREGTSVVVVGGASTAEVAESCEQFRAAERGKSLVIVAILSDAREAPTVLDAGADDFFVDTFDHQPIASRILVARRRARGITSQWRTDQDRAHFVALSPQVLLCEASRGGSLTMVSPGWTALLGWSSTELLSAPLASFVLEADRAAVAAAWSRVGLGREVLGFTARFRHQDGTSRVLDWRAASWPERDVIYGVVTDATAGRVATEALRQVSESLSTILTSMADGVVAMDLTSAVTQINPVAAQLAGWSSAEAKGRSAVEVLRFIDAETRAPVDSPLVRALRHGVANALPVPCLLVRRDGTEVPVADSCAPITSPDGAVTGAVLVFRDITSPLRVASEQAQMRRQLVFADRMAAVGTLAAGVAHEINNPLCYVGANIDLSLEALRASRATLPSGVLQEVEDLLGGAQDGARRVAKIVRGLKTLSRIEDERLGVVDLVAVLELSITMAFNEVRPHAVLVREFGPVPTVVADDTRLVQVFVNLLVNAAHAFPDGMGDRNEIRLVTRTDPDGRAVVEVRDTGIGIAPEVLERMFQPFFTTKPVGIGTGLGLAVSLSIITGIGGELSAESELGQGAVFRVQLPASTAGSELTPTPRSPSTAAPPRRGAVLVVDDEAALGLAIGRVLRQHEVTVVASGEEALRVLATGKEFDVVLSDLMMPRMSGMELYRAIAKRFPSVAPRVVFLTGGAFTPEARRFLEQVDNDRIEKPFATEALRSLVQRLVR